MCLHWADTCPLPRTHVAEGAGHAHHRSCCTQSWALCGSRRRSLGWTKEPWRQAKGTWASVSCPAHRGFKPGPLTSCCKLRGWCLLLDRRGGTHLVGPVPKSHWVQGPQSWAPNIVFFPQRQLLRSCLHRSHCYTAHTHLLSHRPHIHVHHTLLTHTFTYMHTNPHRHTLTHNHVHT